MAYADGKEILFSAQVNITENSGAKEYAEQIENHEARINNHEKRITNLEKQLAPSYILTDESTALQKTVPENACAYAQLNSIGGMSYKTDNLLPLNYNGFASSDSVTDRGCTFTNNGDGGIALSGTPTGAGTVSLGYLTDINTDKITASVSGTFTNAALSLSIYDDNGLIGSAIRVTAETVIDLATDYPNAVRISASIIRRSDTGGELSGVIYPMVNKGGTAKPHSLPFEGLRDSKVIAIKTDKGLFKIPEAVRNIDGYGKGVNETYNSKIIFENEKVYFNQSCRGIVLDGSTDEGWILRTNVTTEERRYFYKVLTQDENVSLNGVCISNNYERVDIKYSNEVKGFNVAPYNNQYCVIVRPEDIATLTVEDFTARLAENPLVVVYGIDSTKIDITDLITSDNIIEVEGGGSVEFVNEHNNAVPASITYMLKEVESV
jgi:hypothetical protein